MLALAVAFLAKFVGGIFARAIIGAVFAAVIAAPFVYTYRQGYSAGQERCETAHRKAFDAAQKAANAAADELQDETLAVEDAYARDNTIDDAAAPAIAAAIERGASDAQCIDADSMRLISETGLRRATNQAAGAAGARAQRGR